MGFQRLGDVSQAGVGIVGQVAEPQERRLIDRILVQHRPKGSLGLGLLPGPGCPHSVS